MLLLFQHGTQHSHLTHFIVVFVISFTLLFPQFATFILIKDNISLSWFNLQNLQFSPIKCCFMHNGWCFVWVFPYVYILFHIFGGLQRSRYLFHSRFSIKTASCRSSLYIQTSRWSLFSSVRIHFSGMRSTGMSEVSSCQAANQRAHLHPGTSTASYPVNVGLKHTQFWMVAWC